MLEIKQAHARSQWGNDEIMMRIYDTRVWRANLYSCVVPVRCKMLEERQARDDSGGGGTWPRGYSALLLWTRGSSPLLSQVVPWTLRILQILTQRKSSHENIQLYVDWSWREYLIFYMLIITRPHVLFKHFRLIALLNLLKNSKFCYCSEWYTCVKIIFEPLYNIFHMIYKNKISMIFVHYSSTSH